MRKDYIQWLGNLAGTYMHTYLAFDIRKRFDSIYIHDIDTSAYVEEEYLWRRQSNLLLQIS